MYSEKLSVFQKYGKEVEWQFKFLKLKSSVL